MDPAKGSSRLNGAHRAAIRSCSRAARASASPTALTEECSCVRKSDKAWKLDTTPVDSTSSRVSGRSAPSPPMVCSSSLSLEELEAQTLQHNARTLMRLASPFQSLDLKEEKTEAEACFVSAETTVTAAVDLRLRDAKKP